MKKLVRSKISKKKKSEVKIESSRRDWTLINEAIQSIEMGSVLFLSVPDEISLPVFRTHVINRGVSVYKRSGMRFVTRRVKGKRELQCYLEGKRNSRVRMEGK